jgi:hypothetical protein
MTMGPGDAPYLARDVIGGVIKANVSAMLDEFPVYNLFTRGAEPLMKAGEVVSLDIDYQERRIAANHTAPGIADRFIHTRFGQILIRSLYHQVKDSIRPNELAQLREAGMSGDLSPSQAEVAAKVQRIVERGTRTILRARERDCCDMLSSASYTRTVDGVSNTITTGLSLLGSGYVSASWATASTDIVGDLGKMLETHIDQAGEDPAVCVMSFRQAGNIAKNDKIRALLNGNGLPMPGELASASAISSVFAALGAPGVRVILHKSHYKNSSGTKTYYWASDRLTLVSADASPDTLGFLTCPQILPDGTLSTASIFSHQWADNETGEHWIRINGVGAPYLGDVEKITLFDLTP